MTTTQKFAGSKFGEDLNLIPRWSIALAAIAFVGMQYVWWVVIPAQRHHPGPPIGLQAFWAFNFSSLAAVYMLMVGYISKDSPRRAMSTRLWLLVCLILPGGIGAVLYFMLRQPIISNCPACGTEIQSEYHFCPQCAYQVSAACGNCYRSVRTSDLHCYHCGHDLATDNTPERLRVFHDQI
jgi:hypothetical protein